MLLLVGLAIIVLGALAGAVFLGWMGPFSHALRVSPVLRGGCGLKLSVCLMGISSCLIVWTSGGVWCA
jgi:hypothetical protein